MDNGSSLVFNANAHPMFGIEYSVNLFGWISFSSMTGFLEFPNQGYIAENAWYVTDGDGRHGVDWGSGASMYSGSFIYSELTTGELRD